MFDLLIVPVKNIFAPFYCYQAPRAKMNQQRSRRFRASKEGAELVEDKKRIREEVIQRGEWSALRCAPEPNIRHLHLTRCTFLSSQLIILELIHTFLSYRMYE